MSFYLPSRWIIKEWMAHQSLTPQSQHLSGQWNWLYLLNQEPSSWQSHTVDLRFFVFWWICKETTWMDFIRDIREPKPCVAWTIRTTAWASCTMWSTGLHFSHTFGTLDLSWCYFCPLHSQSSQPTNSDCGNMSLLKRRKIRTFALLFCAITFTTFLFSYTFRDPSLYFFKYAFHLSDNFFSKGLCACQQCMIELEDDPWFAERFNQSIQPLMTRENSVLSDETFKWWQVRSTGCVYGFCGVTEDWKERGIMHVQL